MKDQILLDSIETLELHNKMIREYLDLQQYNYVYNESVIIDATVGATKLIINIIRSLIKSIISIFKNLIHGIFGESSTPKEEVDKVRERREEVANKVGTTDEVEILEGTEHLDRVSHKYKTTRPLIQPFVIEELIDACLDSSNDIDFGVCLISNANGYKVAKVRNEGEELATMNQIARSIYAKVLTSFQVSSKIDKKNFDIVNVNDVYVSNINESLKKSFISNGPVVFGNDYLDLIRNNKYINSDGKNPKLSKIANKCKSLNDVIAKNKDTKNVDSLNSIKNYLTVLNTYSAIIENFTVRCIKVNKAVCKRIDKIEEDKLKKHEEENKNKNNNDDDKK